ncbi:MAG: hypothetical protein O7G86_01750 [Gammaproteobacteria bacterium]|nr:hypothetical protein [Gammaproteobacteria bacterium]
MSIAEDLISVSKDQYGDETQHRDHLLEMYKTYVEMADRISQHRQSANKFYLSLNSAIIGLIGYVQLGDPTEHSFYWLVAIAGAIISYLWYRQIRSYKDMNSGKFKVVHELEAYLPVCPYDAEWTALGEGKRPDLYLPFTDIEIRVPFVFMAIHVSVIIAALAPIVIAYAG